jgi:hypothetical protein
MLISFRSELSSYLSAATNLPLHLPLYQRADSAGRKNGDLWPLSCWDCGFESHWAVDVCLLWSLCVVTYRSLLPADHWPGGVLPSVVCLSMITEPQQWGDPPGAVDLWKKKLSTSLCVVAGKHLYSVDGNNNNNKMYNNENFVDSMLQYTRSVPKVMRMI